MYHVNAGVPAIIMVQHVHDLMENIRTGMYGSWKSMENPNKDKEW